MLLNGETGAAEIRVFSGGAPQDALRHLAPEFERATGHRVELQSFVVYGTAVPAYNATPDAALAFVKFISDPGKGERWKTAGFELAGSP